MKKVSVILKGGTTINVKMEDEEAKDIQQQFRMNPTTVHPKWFKTTEGTLDLCMLVVHAIIVNDIPQAPPLDQENDYNARKSYVH